MNFNLTTSVPRVAFLFVVFWIGPSSLTCTAQVKNQNKPTTSQPKLIEFNFVQMHMAMPIRITVWCEDDKFAKKVCRAAFAKIGELELVFSDYQKDSELNRLLSMIRKDKIGHSLDSKPIDVSSAMMEVLSFCDRLYKLSERRFDPTAKPVVDLWRIARKNKRLPSNAAIAEATMGIGFHQIKLNPEKQQITISNPNLQLDFGAVAKGYICDQVIQFLKKSGITICRIEAGGDVVLGSSPPGAEGWEIETPFGVERLQNCAISVSADTAQRLELNGETYSHVVDPRSGQALRNRIVTVVVAPTGMQSDALATCGSLMQEHEFAFLLRNYDDVRFRRKTQK